MKCPYCGNIASKVLNSRPTEDNKSIRRRRQCEHCEHRFTTYEKIECMPIMVLKNNQTRQPFDRKKLLKGLLSAFNKREISIDQIDEMVVAIENEIYAMDKNELTTSEIGEIAMQHLMDLDEVSYVRFASVYKKFKNIDEFILELNHIKAIKEARKGTVE